MKYLLFLLLIPAALACVVPEDGMVIDKSTTFCSDVYYLDSGISISGSNITLDCAGAVLNSWEDGKGISIEHSWNVTVKKCRVINYKTGIYVRNSTNVLLINNHLIRNQIGTRFAVVSESSTLNHDVSLQTPFEMLGSQHNALSLTNKFVSGDYCSDNFCNEPVDAVTLFARPKTTSFELQNWLRGQLSTKSAARLYKWVFGEFI